MTAKESVSLPTISLELGEIVDVKEEQVVQPWGDSPAQTIDVDDESYTKVPYGRKRSLTEVATSPSSGIESVIKAARVQSEKSPPVGPIPNSSSQPCSVYLKGAAGADILARSSVKIFADLRNVDGRLGASQVTKGKGFLRIDCSDEHQFKLFSSLTQLGSLDIISTAQNPIQSDSVSYFKVIIFAVNEDTSIEEILSETKEQGCVEAKRLGFMRDDRRTRPVVLSFVGPPPDMVTIGLDKRRTTQFIPKPTRCNNCNRFGHIKLNCRSAARCPHCSGNHSYDDCPDLRKPKEEQISKCCNCGKAHSAASRECTSYLLAKQITTLKTKDRISYAAAAARVRSQPDAKMENNSNRGPVISVSHEISLQQPHIPPVSYRPSVPRPNEIVFSHADLTDTETFCPDRDHFPEIIGHAGMSTRPPLSHPPNQSSVTRQDVFNSLSRETLISLLHTFIDSLLAAVNPSGPKLGLNQLLEVLLAGKPNTSVPISDQQNLCSI